MRKNVEKDILTTISEHLRCKKFSNREEDADRNFVLSLVPHIKQIFNEFKLNAKAESRDDAKI